MKHILYIWILCMMVLMCSACTHECTGETENTKNESCERNPDKDQSLVFIERVSFRSGSYVAIIVEETTTHTRYIWPCGGSMCPIYNPDGTIHKF